tara:strand:- start:4998 stop:5342 length:345 start_codon:yes stop_codon:yes gene_type:complete
MADLHKHSVQESLNTTTGAEWSVKSVGTAGSSASTGNTTHVSLGATAGCLGIYSAVEIYFNFSATTTDVNASNDLKLAKDTLTFITVPRGLGNTIYFNYNSTTSTTGAVRIVEC